MKLTEHLKSTVLVIGLVLQWAGAARAQDTVPDRRVMAWVPPYAVAACRERLDQTYGGVGMKDGLTHLGLQFWHPAKGGSIELVKRFNALDDETIVAFRKWGDTHDVRIMLCVYNGSAAGWDWEAAKLAFDDHRVPFIEALVAEVVRLKLDGVDIDFEGKGPRLDDMAAFVRFVRELSARLHAIGKELTVDSFAYKWNAPNQQWWRALLPYVDGLHVMGYSETGAGAADWRSYTALKAAAGEHAPKLLIGMPGFKGEWQGNSVMTNLQWIADDPEVGVAIWDAQLKASAWRTKEVWQALAGIRGAAAAKVPTILAVGDSITQGGKQFTCYRQVLIPELRKKGMEFEFVGPNTDATSAHAGYGGKNTAYLRSIMKNTYSRYPADIVMIHSGHNSFSKDKPVPAIIRDTEGMIETIRTMNAAATIILGQVIPAGKLPKYSYIPELNKELEALAARLTKGGCNVVLVNHAQGFDWKTDTVSDKVHPNAAGAKKMADKWMEALLPLLDSNGAGEKED
jgi:lysophospholipase L1-like esterase